MTEYTTCRRLLAVGIGPGNLENLTPQARAALAQAEVILGYSLYCDQIKPLLGAHQQLIASGMRQELQRCRDAVRLAASGKQVVVISSGDAGVYGMAGLLLELVAADPHSDLEVTVVPGLTAATTAAALLGAPLMNDYAVISLSDLLTPRAWIEKRLAAVAGADMVCVLYNPRSHKRHELFEFALKTFKTCQGGKLACGMVRNIGRPKQIIWRGILAEMPVPLVDMCTVVMLGNSQSVLSSAGLYTRRGYQLEA